eukprot:scaffold3849_cov179-Amphora_coffeaeformis.AAC.16
MMGRLGDAEKSNLEKLQETATCVTKVAQPNSVVEDNLMVHTCGNVLLPPRRHKNQQQQKRYPKWMCVSVYETAVPVDRGCRPKSVSQSTRPEPTNIERQDKPGVLQNGAFETNHPPVHACSKGVSSVSFCSGITSSKGLHDWSGPCAGKLRVVVCPPNRPGIHGARSHTPAYMVLAVTLFTKTYFEMYGCGESFLKQLVCGTLLVANPLETVVAISNQALFDGPLECWNSMASASLNFLDSFVKVLLAMAGISQENDNGSCLMQSVSEVMPPSLENAIPSACSFFHTVIIAPVTEEIYHRWFISQVNEEIFKVEMETKDTETKRDPKDGTQVSFWRRPFLFGYSPWVLASSAFFGLRHVCNYTEELKGLSLETPPLYLDSSTWKDKNEVFQESKKKAVELVMTAMFQATHAFLLLSDCSNQYMKNMAI